MTKAAPATKKITARDVIEAARKKWPSAFNIDVHTYLSNRWNARRGKSASRTHCTINVDDGTDPYSWMFRADGQSMRALLRQIEEPSE